jgi:hypothetical protein
MYARTATLGILAALTVTLPELSTPSFTLQSTGAVALRATGHEARYGVVPHAVRGRPVLIISLGATAAAGALQLTTMGDQAPAPGRYPIRSSWDELAGDTTSFHASFMPGSVEHPLGWYHGESGWVTIAEAGPGWISGTFELEARGFSAADPRDEERWVTVRGDFEAQSDSTVGTMASAR